MTQPKVFSEKPRVLFVVTEDWYFWSHRAHLARAVRDAGYQVGVATAPGTLSTRISEEGFTRLPFRLNRKSLNPLGALGSLAGLSRVFFRFRPHLVHLVALKPILLGSLAARLVRVPSVVCAVAGMGYVFVSNRRRSRLLRGGVEAFYRRFLRGRDNTHLIVQNPDDEEFLVGRSLVFAEQVSRICGSGVDTHRFSHKPEPPGSPVVLLHSRMLWDKGVGELVEAARILRQRGMDFHVVLVGEPDAANPAAIPRETLIAWNREGAVRWLGRREDIPELLTGAHIACLPSYREGAPLSLIEAASSGRPIVTTDVPGCREVVKHGVNGLLVPPRDPKVLATALRQLIESKPLRLRMGVESRKLAERCLSNEVVVQKTLDVYERMLAKVPGASAIPKASLQRADNPESEAA